MFLNVFDSACFIIRVNKGSNKCDCNFFEACHPPKWTIRESRDKTTCFQSELKHDPEAVLRRPSTLLQHWAFIKSSQVKRRPEKVILYVSCIVEILD